MCTACRQTTAVHAYAHPGPTTHDVAHSVCRVSIPSCARHANPARCPTTLPDANNTCIVCVSACCVVCWHGVSLALQEAESAQRQYVQLRREHEALQNSIGSQVGGVNIRVVLK